VTRLRAE